MLIPGTYFDGKSARGIPVQITAAQDMLQVHGETIVFTQAIADIELSPRLGRTRRQLRFADGAVCEIDDDPLIDQWFASTSHQRWNLLASLEAHWIAVSIAATAIIALVVVIALWGLPWAAQKIALQMPQSWVDQIGSGALIALDETLGKDTELSADRQRELREKFSVLARSANVPAKFEFRTWPQLGANALALPDSTIVMTDELVKLAEDDRELLAVIAHELGHEHERHALQQVLASSGVSALIFVMTGDVSGLANIVVLAPTVLTHLHHSRALERDADHFAFALLQRNAIEPMWFASAIRKLEASHRDEDSESKSTYSSWLSTHPDSKARALEAENYGDKNKARP